MNRIPLLQDAMGEHGVDVCVVAPAENMRYLLGYRAMAGDRLTALIVSRDGAVMVMPDFDVAEFASVAGRPPVIPWSDREGPARAVEAAFAELASPAGASVVDDELPFGYFADVRDRLPGDPGRATPMFSELRLRKSSEEIERIARTGELVSRGIDLVAEVAEPGMTELDLKLRVENLMWEGGADSVDYVLVQAGPNAANAHHNADRTVLRAGEPVLVDIAICLDDYFADITQQVFLGEVPSDYRTHYEVVRRAQEAGVAASKIGATAHDVASAASAVISEAGLGEYNGPRTGHGLGIGVHEAPSVVEGNATELGEGTVITVEPGVYIPGRYGIRIEDTVAATADGPRRLTRGTRPLARRE